jgi:hypothetical protein
MITLDKAKELRDLVTYCGFYCKDCYVGNKPNSIPKLAGNLKSELEKVRYDKFAEYMAQTMMEEFKNYDQCIKVLEIIELCGCQGPCKEGGGNPACEIKKCAQEKAIEGCWMCNDFESCKKYETLEIYHGNANKKNLQEIKRNGIKAFVEGKKTLWYSEG